MTQVKTRLWRSGLEGIATGGTAERAQPAEPPPLDAPVQPCRAEPPPLPSAISMPSTPLRATRLLPVEALLSRPGAEVEAAGRGEETVSVASGVAPQAGAGSSTAAGSAERARGLRPLMAVIATLALALWMAPFLRDEYGGRGLVRRAPPPLPAAPKAVEAPATAPATAGAFAAPPLVESSPAEAARRGGARSDERSAVDALAGGDYGLAASLYGELARLHPAEPVYAEAARILRMRAEPER
jgi:hypothetical protein